MRERERERERGERGRERRERERERERERLSEIRGKWVGPFNNRKHHLSTLIRTRYRLSGVDCYTSLSANKV